MLLAEDILGFKSEFAGISQSGKSRASEIERIRDSLDELVKKWDTVRVGLEEERSEVERMRGVLKSLRVGVERVRWGAVLSALGGETVDPVQVDAVQARGYIDNIVTEHIAEIEQTLVVLKDMVVLGTKEGNDAMYGEMWGALQTPMRIGKGAGGWVKK